MTFVAVLLWPGLAVARFGYEGPPLGFRGPQSGPGGGVQVQEKNEEGASCGGSGSHPKWGSPSQ